MTQGLRRIDPLVFDDNIADNWRKFEKEWIIYCNAGLSDKSEKAVGNCNDQHSPDRSKCFALNKICNNCGKLYHFARCCRSAPAQAAARPKAPTPYKRREMGRVNYLSTEPDNQGV